MQRQSQSTQYEQVSLENHAALPTFLVHIVYRVAAEVYLKKSTSLTTTEQQLISECSCSLSLIM